MKTRLSFAIVLAVTLAVCAVFSLPTLSEVFASRGLRQSLSSVLVWTLFAAAVVAQLAGHVVRARKHTLLLREIRPIRQAQVFRGQMIGLAFNALLPLRVGELMRAHYVGRTVQISRAAVFATVMFERLIDLVVVAAIGTPAVALTGGLASSPLAVPVAAAWCLAVVIAVLLTVTYRQPRWYLKSVFTLTGLLNESLCNRGRQVAWSFSHALLYALPGRRILGRYLAMSAGMWAAYLLAAAAVLTAVDAWPSTTPTGAAVLLDAPYLGVTTSTAPAWFGAFADQYGQVVAPWLPGGGHVALFTLLAWLLLVVPGIVVGAVCLAHRTLVEHATGALSQSASRNKMFREDDTSREFAHLLSAHFEGEELGMQISREEARGHFTVVRPLKGGSHASTLLVWQDGELLVKKITLPQYRSKLESQYDWLRERSHLPNVVNVLRKTSSDSFFSIDIEYRPGYRSFFEHLHSATNDDAWAVLRGVLDFTRTSLYRDRDVEEREQVFDRYVQSKVYDKVLDAGAISKDVSRLMGYETVVVNGVTYDNLHVVLTRIREDPRAMRDLLDFRESPIHGDLTIDNLMVDPATSEFMLIDPNDENLISDPVVDHGKILQSLHSGYEFFLLHDDVAVDGNRIEFEERRSAQYAHLYAKTSEYLAASLGPERWRAVVFHEAVHFTRMLTYRAAIDPATTALYFAVAVRLFNEFREQYDALEAMPVPAAEHGRPPAALVRGRDLSTA